MAVTNSIAKPSTSELGNLLRHWRDQRGKSQLELSLDSGVSQRHISFIESGRSVPSRLTLIGIAQSLEVPLGDRNILLLASGYAPVYSDCPWNSEEMSSINKVLARMLRQHEPFAAVVMDRYWNVLVSNDSAPQFFGLFTDMAARGTPRNMLDLMFDPNGMRPFIADWERTAQSLIQRVHRESVGRVIDGQTQALLEKLLGYPDVHEKWATLPTASTLPFIPLSFVHQGQVLNYFSMITTVGSPQTVAAEELRLECLFPADEDTEARHRALMS
jgi:transcriptional regulator with XRE-family HTH domain